MSMITVLFTVAVKSTVSSSLCLSIPPIEIKSPVDTTKINENMITAILFVFFTRMQHLISILRTHIIYIS
ncbi:hypothetical protein, partial [Hominenteromicrobium sp.]|uniref:hypothetical protein n=1 Tax=Hominenteromicrobium sp. TaxID=3073581 RepID=UPI003AEF8732